MSLLATTTWRHPAPERLRVREAQKVRASLEIGGRNSYAHNVTVKLNDDEIEKIKAVVSKAPNCKNTGQYRWPFTGANAKFTSKDDVDSKFKFV